MELLMAHSTVLNIEAWAFIIFGIIFWIFWILGFLGYFDKFQKSDSDEDEWFTIEIVHEKPEKPQDDQREHSTKPSAEKTSFYSHSRLIGKGNYIPE